MSICKCCGANNVDPKAERCPFCNTPFDSNSFSEKSVKKSPVMAYVDGMDDKTLLEFAECKLNGIGVEKNVEEAEELFLALALRNNYDGMYRLARIYLDRNDKRAAAKWLKIAAEGGHEESILLIRVAFDEEYEQGYNSAKTIYDETFPVKKQDRESVADKSFNSDRKRDFIDIVNESKSCVLMIESYKIVDPSRLPMPEVKLSLGSGFIIEGGLVITNAHVVGDKPDKIIARFMKEIDDIEYELLPIYVSFDYDIAVLSFKGLMMNRIIGRKNLSLRTERVNFGEEVYTIGNPKGLGFSVSNGVVSNPEQHVTYKKVESVIQTDITINHGNSGGALLDYENNVLGIVTFTPSKIEGGISMCVPSGYIAKVLNTIDNSVEQ